MHFLHFLHFVGRTFELLILRSIPDFVYYTVFCTMIALARRHAHSRSIMLYPSRMEWLLVSSRPVEKVDVYPLPLANRHRRRCGAILRCGRMSAVGLPLEARMLVHELILSWFASVFVTYQERPGRRRGLGKLRGNSERSNEQRQGHVFNRVLAPTIKSRSTALCAPRVV